jgi:hypothetical protein
LAAGTCSNEWAAAESSPPAQNESNTDYEGTRIHGENSPTAERELEPLMCEL